MATSDLMAQIAAMQQQLAALIAAASAAAAAPAPPPAPAPVAPVAVHVAMPAPAYFTDANGVEWIAEGIKRWNYGIDQATLLPPVPLPAGNHNGGWNSGDPYRYQQRDPAFLTSEMQRIRAEWAAANPPKPRPPQPVIPGALY